MAQNHLEDTLSVVSTQDAEQVTITAAPVISRAEAEASRHREEHADWGYVFESRFIGTLLGIIFVVLAVAGSYNVPTSILTAINNDLGPSAEYSNITILWTISSATSLIVMGRCSDLFGRRWFVLGSAILGFIGALISGEAKSIPMLVAAQIFTGPAAPTASAFQTYIGELMPIKHRGYWTTIVLICCAPLQQFGPVFGQLFATRLTWRWVYRLSAILWVVAFTLLFIFYHPPRFDHLHVRYSKKTLVKQFDWVGIALYTVGLVLFCFGVSWGGGFFAWKSAAVISTIAIGGIVFIGFFFWEAFAPLRTPLVSIKFLTHEPRKFLFPFLSSTIGGMFFYGVFLIWPIEIAAVYTDLSPVMQGWYSASVYIGTLMGSAFGGTLFQLGNEHRLKVIVLNVMMIAFAAGASQCTREQRAATTACLAMAGACCGCMESCFALWIAASRSVENIGLSLGLLGSFRNVAGAIASAIYISIINNRSTTLVASGVSSAVLSLGLPQTSLPDLFAAMAAGTPEAFAAVPGITPEIAGAVPIAVGDAYVESFKTVYYVVIAFGAIGLFFSLLSVRDISENITNHVGKSLYTNAKPADDKTIMPPSGGITYTPKQQEKQQLDV